MHHTLTKKPVFFFNYSLQLTNCNWTTSWPFPSWSCLSFKAILRIDSHVNELTFGTHFQGTEAKGHTLLCQLLWINSVWYSPAVYSDGGIAWLLLPSLYLANDIDQSCTWVWRANIRPSSVLVLTNHSRCTLLLCEGQSSYSTLNIMLLWRTRKIYKTFRGQL